MFRLILQTQGRLGGFSVLSHLLSTKVKSTLLSTNDLQCALNAHYNEEQIMIKVLLVPGTWYLFPQDGSPVPDPGGDPAQPRLRPRRRHQVGDLFI